MRTVHTKGGGGGGGGGWGFRHNQVCTRVDSEGQKHCIPHPVTLSLQGIEPIVFGFDFRLTNVRFASAMLSHDSQGFRVSKTPNSLSLYLCPSDRDLGRLDRHLPGHLEGDEETVSSTDQPDTAFVCPYHQLTGRSKKHNYRSMNLSILWALKKTIIYL